MQRPPFSVVAEPFDADDSVRLRAAARIEVDRTYGRPADRGRPLTGATAAAHVIARDRTGLALGTASLSAAGDGVFEVRRLFVRPDSRGQGVGDLLLLELLAQAEELQAPAVVAEIGALQPHAAALLTRNGFVRIMPFGPYREDSESVCFSRAL
ncbi:GNAT family N-acetyltransferase [Curtobacterium sp. VKM Ac-1393]|uniref:GNAT family N-acetyltransferase n=1 Tax=Curtobacterium sp. VKM Ac-1393 TaxID=2783814 RepID=UPI00188C5716|nr:GNAT family N-acetyltransferase [Curtobacterium sp. VKM Ac-1393]MBF4606089.1 GNAT family N-acetyltransferase [Curtobacterium sp. VKM Ac-1393]